MEKPRLPREVIDFKIVWKTMRQNLPWIQWSVPNQTLHSGIPLSSRFLGHQIFPKRRVLRLQLKWQVYILETFGSQNCKDRIHEPCNTLIVCIHLQLVILLPSCGPLCGLLFERLSAFTPTFLYYLATTMSQHCVRNHQELVHNQLLYRMIVAMVEVITGVHAST